MSLVDDLCTFMGIKDDEGRALVALMVTHPSWRLVPVEPTEEMALAGRMRQDLPGGGRITMWAANRWSDMLAAAPDPRDEPSVSTSGPRPLGRVDVLTPAPDTGETFSHHGMRHAPYGSMGYGV